MIMEGDAFARAYRLGETKEVTQLKARCARLEAALVQIRGWREIGSADTPREKLTVIEEMVTDALKDSEQ